MSTKAKFLPKTNMNPSIQPRRKYVSKPVAGSLYIALEDGRLVPVQTMPQLGTSTIGQQKTTTNSGTISGSEQQSVSTDNVQSEQLSCEVMKSMPVDKNIGESLVIDDSGYSYSPVLNKEKQKLLKSHIKSRPKSVKIKSNNEAAFGPTKKFKADETNDISKVNVNASSSHSETDDDELTHQESETRNSVEEQNTDISYPFGDTLEESSSEYIYDELLNDDEEEAEPQFTQSEEIHSESQRYVTNDTFQLEDSEEITEEEMEPKENTAKPNNNKATPGSRNIPTDSFRMKDSSFSKLGATISPSVKSQKMNEKFPELPVPTNINQFGDCLKTRLGRYHYGLTLNDPPCQFFQGVLKGASGQTLAVLFGDINLISKFEGAPLHEVGHFAIDTTFKVIPDSTTGVSNVLTVSLIFKNLVIPLWYAVTSCSSPELYKRILIEFQQHVLDWPFTSVLLDNDPALCKAVLALFPDIDLHGSWFYYGYSIWRELCMNNIAEKCKKDPAMMSVLKMLLVVPYLPPLTDTPSSITMLEGFEIVRQLARNNNLPKEFHRVLDYVATFWFNIVKSKNFTVFGKQTISLNYVEIFQLSLLSYMRPGGNVWTLTHSFQSVARTANLEFNRYINGKPFALKKNRGRKFNVPIRQNMKRLMIGVYDVKTFLEKSVIYCDEMLDIFLHPLYPTTTTEKTNYVHTNGWKTKIISH